MNCEDVHFSLANKSVHDAIRSMDGFADILAAELRDNTSSLGMRSRVFDGIK